MTGGVSDELAVVRDKIAVLEAQLEGLRDGHAERVPLQQRLAALEQRLAALEQQKLLLMQQAQGGLMPELGPDKCTRAAVKPCCVLMHSRPACTLWAWAHQCRRQQHGRSADCYDARALVYSLIACSSTPSRIKAVP